MTVQKKEDQTKVEVLKIAKRNISDLGTFIRLVDYMVLETQVKINQEGAEMVYGEMSMDERKAGIITEIDYGDTDMIFVPAENEFVNHFDKLLQDMVSATAEITRITHNTNFNQYTHGIISGSGPNFKEIVDDSEDYKLIKNRITQKFIDDFALLHEDTTKFETCRPVYEFTQTFNYDDYIKTEPDLKSIQKNLDKMKEWEQVISNVIKAQLIKGLIFGNGKKLRDKLNDTIRENLLKIRKYLIELTIEKEQDVLERLKKMTKGLKAPMGNLTDYVDYVKYLTESKEELANLNGEKATIEHMMTIIKKSGKTKDTFSTMTASNLEQSVQIKYDNILNEIDICRSQIYEKEAEVSGGMDKKVEELEESINEVKGRVKDIIDKIDRDKLIEASTPSEEALKELNDKIKSRFEPLRKTATYNMDAQKILNQQVTQMEEIDEFDRRWEARHKLWKTRNDWDQDYNTWFNEVFQGQDALEIEQRLKEYEKDMTWLKQNLPRDIKDEVLEKLIEDVRGTSNMKELVLDLGNKALMERHWIKIFALLPDDNAYAPSRTFTLNELINGGVLQVKDKIGEISAIASGEYAISQTLEEIKKIWATLDFVIVNYRDFKDRFILGSIEEIMIQLEDHQVSIQTMLSSKNVKEIRDDVTE